MAIPRVFVSSTCYDLKYIRETLKYFINRLGYEAVLSEDGRVFFNPSQHTHDACIAEVPNCQIFVLIIGGRFGAQFKGEAHSVTNEEYREAVRLKIPIFALVEQGVYNESQLYFHNRENNSIDARSIIYPSVDNISIFEFINEVRSEPNNNAIVPFNNYKDIESYLLNQWAGMMYSYLIRDNENTRVAGALGAIKKINEKIEILSRQTLRSIGTQEAKITAELYDTIITIAGSDFLKIGSLNITPKLILENPDIESYISALGFEYDFDDSDTLLYSGESVGCLPYKLYRNRYAKIREELINILKKHNISIKEYISKEKE